MELNSRVFWHNVRIAREAKGWSQQQIADQLGMNVKNYNAKERGYSVKLSLALAEKIAEILGITIDELTKGEVPEEPLVSPEIANFWNNVRTRREKLQLSQKDIAEKLGMSTQNYQSKESGRAAKLPADLAEQVAKILNTSIDELHKIDNKNQTTQETLTENIITSNLNNKYDIGHLPESVARFLSDKSNEKTIINMVLEYFMNKK